MLKHFKHKICALVEKNTRSGSLSTARILIVDDDPLVTKFIVSVLKKSGYNTIRTALSHDEALANNNNEPFDIVIMDIYFKNTTIDGITLAKKIQESTDCALIYITGDPDHRLMDRIKETKPLGFIHKPITVEDLQFTVELAFENFKMRRSLQKSESRYQTMLACTADYVYHVTVHNEKEYTSEHNHNVIAITGHTVKEFKENPWLWLLIVHPDDQELVKKFTYQILHEHTALPIEHRIIKKNGEIRWIRNTPVFHFDENGIFIAYDGMITDITERKIAEEKLQEYMDQLEDIVQQRTESLIRTETTLRLQNTKLLYELNGAKNVQKLLLPPKKTEYDIVTIAYKYKPLDAIGGDFLFYTPLRRNRVPVDQGTHSVGIFIGDVTGHGVSAALYSSCLKVLTDKICTVYGSRPGQYLQTLNNELLHLVNHDPRSHYITGIYGLFQKNKKNNKTTFTFANGGHPPILVHKKSTKELVAYNAKGPMFGFENTGVTFLEEKIDLEPGDRIFLYTDGLLELNDLPNKEIDLEGFINIIEEKNDFTQPVEIIPNTIMREILSMYPHTDIHDDMMVVVIDIK